MARSISSPNDQAAALRNLKVLVVLLVLSNILVGVLGGYLLRAVDRRYTELLERSVPALNDLRELINTTVAAMRSTNPRNFTAPGANAPAALQVSRERLAALRKFRQTVLMDSYFSDKPAAFAAIVTSGTEFDRLCTEYLEQYAGGRQAEAIRLRDEKMLPSFDRHVAAIGTAADAVESTSLAASRDYTTRTNSLSTIVLGVASWPLILLFALLLLTALFVIAMMIVFRGKDLADMP